MLVASLSNLSLPVARLTCVLNTESGFTEKYLLKLKPFILGILCRPPNKIDFVNCIGQTISLMYSKLKIVTSSGIVKEIFSDEIIKIAYDEPLLKKKYVAK